MENNLKLENCWSELPESECQAIGETVKKAEVLQYSTTDLIAETKGSWYNTLKISISYGIRAGATRGYMGYKVEFGTSPNKRAIIPGLFNGLSVLDVNRAKGEKFGILDIFTIFKIFVKLIKGLADFLSKAWEELDKMFNESGNGSGGDPMKTIAVPDTSNLDQKKDDIIQEHPSADPQHPQDAVPSKPPGIGKDGIRGTDKASSGVGIWYYTAEGKYYQLVRGEWTKYMVVNQPKDHGVTIPNNAIGLYFVWIPQGNLESGGNIWGRWFLYESK